MRTSPPASVAYDADGWQPEFKALIEPSLKGETPPGTCAAPGAP